MEPEVSPHQSAPGDSTRRDALTKIAGGAGVAAATWASPMISGIGIAPAHAQACTSPPAPPTWNCTPNTTPTCTAQQASTATATASNIQRIAVSGNSTVYNQIGTAQRDALLGGVSVPYLAQSCRPTALCPGGSGNYSVTFTVDFCSFYNTALAAARAGLVGQTGNPQLLGFSLSVTNPTLSWAGQQAVFPNFSSNSLTPIAACPISRTINVPVRVADYPDITLDPVTCLYECADPASPAIPSVFASAPTLTATQTVYTQIRVVVLVALTGSATTSADLAGSGQIPPAPGLIPIPALCG